MSGPSRFCLAAVLMLAGLSTWPVSANPFDALFNRAPEEAAAPPPKDAPAKEECLPRPGKPVDGQHWFYRLDGHRRCWYLADEGAASVRQRTHHHAAKRQLDAAEENEAAPPRKRKAVVDARAELLRPAPAETPQPAPPAAGVQLVDAAPTSPMGAAALVPPPPVLAKPDQPEPDQLTAEHPDPRQAKVQDNMQDNVETLLAATPANSDPVSASAAPAASMDAPVVTGDDGPWWTAPWFGPVLMTLGGVLLLGASTPLRRLLLVAGTFWAREGEGPLALPRSESDSQPRPRDRHHARVTPARSRQGTEEQARSSPLGETNPEMTFQEAIRALNDFEEISAEAHSSALRFGRADAAPVFGRSRTRPSRVS